MLSAIAILKKSLFIGRPLLLKEHVFFVLENII